MQIFDTSQVALERAMAGASLRHQALADNLANVNTPGYRRKDVDFQSTLAQAMGSGKDPRSVAFGITEDPSAPMRADGSSVDADAESAAIAKNGLVEETIASVLKAKNDVLKAAMGVS